jgi:hypothetical protein
MSSTTIVDEIKNFYNTSQARSELEDLLQSHRLFHKSDDVIRYIKLISNKDTDSYTIRETGKFLSDLINELKLKYEIKD